MRQPADCRLNAATTRHSYAPPKNLATPVHWPSSQLHQHLSEVLALKQFEKGCGRVLDAVVYGFPPCDLSFADPRGHLSLELGHEIEIVRDVESLKPKALAHDEHDVTWSVGQ